MDGVKPRKRVWVQNVAVSARVLQSRVDAAAARGLDEPQKAVAEGVRDLLARACAAAYKDDPRPTRWANWWRGSLVDAAYQNLHAARAEIVDLYDKDELAAEIPTAIARAQRCIHRDDPRHIEMAELAKKPIEQQRALLRRSIENSYDASDRQHEQVRSFRNIVLASAVLIAALVGVTVVFVAFRPTAMPLCFRDTATAVTSCPTRTGARGPTGGDILVIALLGLLGGSLAAALSIRKLRGTSTPYDIPVALALLKAPLGAFTAIIGLIAIQGDFVPGLSNLDSQEQILAYALLLGFGQQVFTRLLDKQAQDLLNALPEKDPSKAPPPVPSPPAADTADDVTMTIPETAKTAPGRQLTDH
jgi:hypothetical protein